MAKLLLYWLPRCLGLALILFLSLFALDALEEGHGVVQITALLLRHLVPSFILLTGLILAWEWEWVGTLFFGAAAGLMLYIVWGERVPFYMGSLEHKLIGSMALATPALVVAVLFLLGWFRRQQFHAPDKRPE